MLMIGTTFGPLGRNLPSSRGGTGPGGGSQIKGPIQMECRYIILLHEGMAGRCMGHFSFLLCAFWHISLILRQACVFKC